MVVRVDTNLVQRNISLRPIALLKRELSVECGLILVTFNLFLRSCKLISR